MSDGYTKTCMTCRYFHDAMGDPNYEGEADGDCRRFPPRTTAGVDGDPVSAFPAVDASWWCGEHKE